MTHDLKLLRVVSALSSGLALFVLVIGAVRTSATIWSRVNPVHMMLARSPALAISHQFAGSLLILLLAWVAWLGWKSGERVFQVLSLTAFGVGVLELVTVLGSPLQDATWRAVAHAICGHVLFACLAAAAAIACTSSRHTQLPASITGGFPLRSLSAWMPPLVLTQVAMGALYRHDVWGVMPHMAGAMVVAFLLISVSVIILQQAPEHRLLHRAAVWAIAMVIVQISLGIADFLVRLLDFEDSVFWVALSVAHVTNAALTFAASICLAVSVRAYAADTSIPG